MFSKLPHAFIVAALALAPSCLAFAQASPPPHVPLQKTIGAAKPELVPSLFVINSRGATLQLGKLVLTGVAQNAIVFTDRPVRAAGHDLTSVPSRTRDRVATTS